MNVVFMGTPEFAVPTLKKLIENYEVKAVFTQPDKPKGRGKKIAFSEVKEEALKHNIPIFQPIKLKNDQEAITTLKNLEPDFIIVVAFGQLLPKEVLDIPKCACINLHGSLLPKYRGAAPIQWAVIDGEEISGNTTMLMDVGLDTGDILLQSKVTIEKDMTAGELHDILMHDGADLIIETINSFKEIKPIKQIDSESCYAKMLSREKAEIQWIEKANNINNSIRGLNPWPIAYTLYNGEKMKIYKAEVIEKVSENAPGTIIEVSDEGILVVTGEKCLLIKELQFPNGKRLTVKQYLNGNNIEKGILGI